LGFLEWKGAHEAIIAGINSPMVSMNQVYGSKR